jgi:hypothetical protein
MDGKPGPVEIQAGETPQDHAVPGRYEAPEDAGHESGGECAILLVAACPQDLVQGAPRKSAARQHPVDRGDAKRQYPMGCRRRPLDPPDALPELRKRGSFLDHVPSLFSF